MKLWLTEEVRVGIVDRLIGFTADVHVLTDGEHRGENCLFGRKIVDAHTDGLLVGPGQGKPGEIVKWERIVEVIVRP